jgi:integrase
MQKDLHPLYERYLSRLDGMGRNYRTLVANRQALTHLNNWFEAKGIDPCDPSDLDVEDFFNEQSAKYAPQTVINRLRVVGACYRYATKIGDEARRRGEPLPIFAASHDPTGLVGKPKLNQKPIETFSTSELRRIFENVHSEREHLLCLILAYSGLRISEALSLKWENTDGVNYWNRETHEFLVQGKGGYIRNTPVHPVLEDALYSAFKRPGQKYIIESQKTKDKLSNPRAHELMTSIFKRADVQKTGLFHVFRKTVATRLEAAEVSPYVVDLIMGWKRGGVAQKYYLGIPQGRAHEAILKLYANEPIINVMAAA